MQNTSSARFRLAAATILVWSATLGLTGVASAQYVNSPPGGGPATDVETAPVETTPVAQLSGGDSRISRSDSSLPVTGGDVVALVGIGVGSVAAGGLLLAFRRRSAPALN
jgi:LPXTG-motif cell wall-anchored protein